MFFNDKSLFFYLTVPPLSEAALRTKSLRKLAERSKSFLCFGSSWIHVPVRVLLHTLLSLCFGSSLHDLYMPSRTGTEPTAHGMSR